MYLTNCDTCSNQILKVDEEKRKAQTHLQKLLSERNIISKEIGNLKSKKLNTDHLTEKVELLKNQINSNSQNYLKHSKVSLTPKLKR